MASLLNPNSYAGRNRLLFILLMGSLYMPGFFFPGFFISLFVLHSFFAKGFLNRFTRQALVALILFGGFFVWTGVSVLYSDNTGHGLDFLVSKLSFLLLPVGIIGSGIHKNAEYRKLVMNVFIGLTLLAAIAALINAGVTSYQAGSFSKIADDDGTMVKQYYFTYTHLAFFIMHPAYFSMYVGAAIFTGLHLIITNSSYLKQRWLQWAILAFLFVFLFLLQGRISILAFLIMLFVGVLIYFFSSGSYVKGLALVLAPVGFIVAVLVFAPPSLTRRFTEFSSMEYNLQATSIYDFNGFTIRLAEWECALDAIAEKPIIGHGLGDAHQRLLQSYRENNFVVGMEKGFNCHNQYLETLLQSGIIGLALFVAMLIWMVVIAYKNKDLLIFTLMGFVAVSLITESILERQWGIGLFTSFILFLVLSSFKAKELKGT